MIFICRSGAPVYEIPYDSYTAERILEILLSPIEEEKICNQQPMGINTLATFVVDLNSLKHPDDIKKDEFGKWQYTGSHNSIYIAWKEDDSLQFDKVKFDCSITPMEGNMFQLRKIYCKHPSNAQFQRLLAFVKDHKENPHHLCLVSYRIPTGFVPSVTPHGNSKSKKPFYPTLPSTKLKIQSESKFRGPKSILNSVSNDVGGVIGAKGPCDLPRNERQVCYIKKKSTSAAEQPGKPPDEILALLFRAKSEDDGSKFVQETKISPEPPFVVAREWQLDDLV